MQKHQRSRIIIVLCLVFLKPSLCEKESHWLRGRGKKKKISASHLCPHLKCFWKRNNDSLKCFQLSFKLPLMTCRTETEKKKKSPCYGTWDLGNLLLPIRRASWATVQPGKLESGSRKEGGQCKRREVKAVGVWSWRSVLVAALTIHIWLGGL